MATVIKCDRCGKEIGDNNSIRLSTRIAGNLHIPYKDLCEECSEALDEWLKPKERKEEE